MLVKTQVMIAFKQHGRHDDLLALWRELVLMDGLGNVDINGRTCNMVLKAAVKTQRWQEVEGILDLMKVLTPHTSKPFYQYSKSIFSRVPRKE